MNNNSFGLSLLSDPVIPSAFAHLTTALYAPVLTKEKMAHQADLLQLAMEKKAQAQSEILATMRHLSNNNQLSTDRFNSFLTLYLQVSTSTP